MKHIAVIRHLFAGLVSAFFSATLVILLWGHLSPASAAKPVDPCSLLTKSDVSAVLGAEVKEGKLKSVVPGKNYCEYGIGKGALQLFSHNDLGFKEGFRNGRDKDPKTEPVTGIGDEAYWWGGSKILHVLTKDVYLQISGVMVSGWSVDKAKDLARRALARLR